MSVPHTGRLIAEIDGRRCEFDGDLWVTPSPALSDLLNFATDHAPKTHYTIKEVAQHVFAAAGLQRATIIEWKSDDWPEELPPGALD
jgi:hypothetical protein